MSWNFDWSVIGEAITDMIHYVGNTLRIIIDTIKVSF